MRKVILVLIVLAMFTGFVFANEDMDLSSFPKGKWQDDSCDYIWEFTADTVRILDTDGVGEMYTFADKTIEGWTLVLIGTSPQVTFSVKESGWQYKFHKEHMQTPDFIMEIKRPDRDEIYEVGLTNIELLKE